MDILKRPLVTEKGSSLNGRDVYGLIVDNRATKTQIKKEVERFYGVVVEKINTMRYGSRKRLRFLRGHTILGKIASYKKVLVTLRSGGSIDFYEGI